MISVMLSALSHYSYCPRRCGLIHLESVWDENIYTLRGRQGHERADSEKASWEGGVRIERGLPLFSEVWGLIGKADVVEFHPDGSIIPVEYKSGPSRASIHDDLQLCGQALCLEEMLQTSIERGAIYSLKARRRRDVIFDEELREATSDAIAAVRSLLDVSLTAAGAGSAPLPPALNDRRCRKCSLVDACVPDTVLAARAAWHERSLFRVSLTPGNGGEQ